MVGSNLGHRQYWKLKIICSQALSFVDMSSLFNEPSPNKGIRNRHQRRPLKPQLLCHVKSHSTTQSAQVSTETHRQVGGAYAPYVVITSDTKLSTPFISRSPISPYEYRIGLYHCIYLFFFLRELKFSCLLYVCVLPTSPSPHSFFLPLDHLPLCLK